MRVSDVSCWLERSVVSVSRNCYPADLTLPGVAIRPIGTCECLGIRSVSGDRAQGFNRKTTLPVALQQGHNGPKNLGQLELFFKVR